MTPEERIASLEIGLSGMKEGIAELKSVIEKLDSTVSTLVDKMDLRYATKESVDLRIEALEVENKSLRSTVKDLNVRVNKLTAWMYKSMGAIGFLTIGSAIVWYARHF